MTGRWRVERVAQLHANSYFRVVRSLVQRPDNSTADYHTIDFLRPSVSIVLCDRQDCILLIRQQRFIVDRQVWAIPSGGVEDGEGIEHAAERELVEETGFRAKRIRQLVSYYPSYGSTNQVFHCFLALDPVPAQAYDTNETQRTKWFTRAEVQRAMVLGEIPDGFSLTPLLFLMAGLEPQPLEAVQRCRRVAPEAELDEG